MFISLTKEKGLWSLGFVKQFLLCYLAFVKKKSYFFLNEYITQGRKKKEYKKPS